MNDDEIDKEIREFLDFAFSMNTAIKLKLLKLFNKIYDSGYEKGLKDGKTEIK
jgi:hypothetical protein